MKANEYLIWLCRRFQCVGADQLKDSGRIAVNGYFQSSEFEAAIHLNGNEGGIADICGGRKGGVKFAGIRSVPTIGDPYAAAIIKGNDCLACTAKHKKASFIGIGTRWSAKVRPGTTLITGYIDAVRCLDVGMIVDALDIIHHKEVLRDRGNDGPGAARIARTEEPRKSRFYASIIEFVGQIDTGAEATVYVIAGRRRRDIGAFLPGLAAIQSIIRRTSAPIIES